MKIDPVCCSASALCTSALLFRVTSDQHRQKGKEEQGLGEHMPCTLLLVSLAQLALRNTALRHIELSGEGKRSWRDSRGRKNSRKKSQKLEIFIKKKSLKDSKEKRT